MEVLDYDPHPRLAGSSLCSAGGRRRLFHPLGLSGCAEPVKNRLAGNAVLWARRKGLYERVIKHLRSIPGYLRPPEMPSAVIERTSKDSTLQGSQAYHDIIYYAAAQMEVGIQQPGAIPSLSAIRNAGRTFGISSFTRRRALRRRTYGTGMAQPKRPRHR